MYRGAVVVKGEERRATLDLRLDEARGRDLKVSAREEVLAEGVEDGRADLHDLGGLVAAEDHVPVVQQHLRVRVHVELVVRRLVAARRKLHNFPIVRLEFVAALSLFGW